MRQRGAALLPGIPRLEDRRHLGPPRRQHRGAGLKHDDRLPLPPPVTNRLAYGPITAIFLIPGRSGRIPSFLSRVIARSSMCIAVAWSAAAEIWASSLT